MQWKEEPTDRPTNQPSDGPTDRHINRVNEWEMGLSAGVITKRQVALDGKNHRRKGEHDESGLVTAENSRESKMSTEITRTVHVREQVQWLMIFP